MHLIALILAAFLANGPAAAQTPASAADDDAISTAYSGAWPVPNTWANTTPSRAATAPTATALSKAFGIADRSVLSRTGTCVPTTNITNANPILASRVKVASV